MKCTECTKHTQDGQDRHHTDYLRRGFAVCLVPEAGQQNTPVSLFCSVLFTSVISSMLLASRADSEGEPAQLALAVHSRFCPVLPSHFDQGSAG